MMIQKVPYFRELVIASFYCDHCGESNNDVTFGGEIQVKSVQYLSLILVMNLLLFGDNVGPGVSV